MTKPRTSTTTRATPLDEALWRAERLAADALMDDARLWWPPLQDERSRQLDARAVEGATTPPGAVLDALRARWAEEDAAFTAARLELRRRKCSWWLIVEAARRRRRAGRPQ